MPHPFDKKGVLIPNNLRKNTKISSEDRLEIIELRKKGLSYRKIAAIFGVCHKRIMQICNNDVEKRDRERFLIAQKEKKYYSKEKHKMYMRKHRSYKKMLFENAKLEGIRKQDE